MKIGRIGLAVFALALSSRAVIAAGGPVALEPIDKSGGEEDEIRERLEWFEHARGLDDHPVARVQRAQAVTALRDTLARGTPNLLARETWLPLGPDGMTMLDWDMGRVAGRVTALAVDPDDEETLYLGAAAGGLWKSVDAGGSWTQLFDRIGTESIGSILLEKGAPEHLWVGTGEANAGCLDYFGMGLFYSDDGGATFTARNGSGSTAMPLSFVTAIAQSPLDPQVLIVGGQGHCGTGGGLSGGGLYRSADAGESWTQVLSSSGALDILFDPDDGSLAYAAVRSKGIYKSTDAGQSWTRLENGLPINSAATYSRIAMAPSDSSILYALIGSAAAADLQLYRSADAGASWTEVNPAACEGQCFYNLTLDVHPTDPDRVLVGTIRPALSTDGGATLTILTANWGSQQAVHQDTHLVQYSRNDGARLWVGGDGGLWRSDDGGGSFSNLNANLEITQFYDIALDPRDPSRVYGGAQDNSSSRRDGEDVWDVTEATGDGFMNAVDATNPARVFQTSYPNDGGPNLILSTAHGEPYSYQWVNQSGLVGSEPFAWVTPLTTAAGSVFVASNRVYRAVIGDDANAYEWTPISDSLTGTASASISVLTPAAAGADGHVRLYAGTANGKIAMTPDARSRAPTWSDISRGYPGGNVSDLAVDPHDETRVFVTRSVFAAPHLLESVDGGDWTAVGDGLPALPANSVAIDPLDSQRIFVGTDIGVYASSDGGATFTPFMAGLPLGMVVTDLEISAEPHVLVAATYGRGAWNVVLDGSDVVFRDGFEVGAAQR
jgi:photosystem II stability/assembly factor-like uncharacterized protein